MLELMLFQKVYKSVIAREGGGIPGIAGLNDDCFGVQVEFCGGDDFANCFEEGIVIFCIGE